MARVLGWDTDREEREVQTYLKRVEAERASQLQPDDESADRIRLEAPDIVDVDAAAGGVAVERRAEGRLTRTPDRPRGRESPRTPSIPEASGGSGRLEVLPPTANGDG